MEQNEMYHMEVRDIFVPISSQIYAANVVGNKKTSGRKRVEVRRNNKWTTQSENMCGQAAGMERSAGA